MEGVFCDDVHLSMEQLLQIHQQPAEVEQAASLFQVNEKIHVTRLVRGALSHGAEHAHVVCAVLCRDVAVSNVLV